MVKTRKERILDYIEANPNLSGLKVLEYAKDNGFGIRKQEFYKLYRDYKKLPEPTKEKKLKSTPIKYRVIPSKVSKPKKVKIPFEKTKFGKIAKDIEKIHGISERNAIERTRALLKIPKKDYKKLNKKDVLVLSQYGY